MDGQRIPSVPKGLKRMIRLNVPYQVFICPHKRCHRAIQPSAFARHSWEEHGTTFGTREKLKEFINELGWEYEPKTVELPKDGSKPQPIIPVVDVFECQSCEPDPHRRPFKSSSEKCVRTHWYEEHWDATHEEEGHKKRGAARYREVRGQTWFCGGGEARYWRVREESMGSDDGEDGARYGLPIDGGTGVGAVEAIRGDGIDAVDGPVIAIPSDGEVETMEEAPVVIIDSDDEVLVPTRRGPVRRGPVRVVDDGVDSSDDESFGDADYEPGSSSGEVSTGGEGESSETDRAGDEDGEECDTTADDEGVVVATSRTRKRKIQRAFEDWGIDSNDDTCQTSRMRFNKRRRPPRKEARVVDSGIAMPSSSQSKVSTPSSHDDVFEHGSSPPTVGWMMVTSRPEGEGRLQEPGRAVYGATDDEGEGRESEVPPPSPVISPYGQRPTLEVLKMQLDTWCQVCPVCVLDGDFGGEVHQIEECWRHSTVDIINETACMEQHVGRHGGFQGWGGCSWCGIPRAICRRWDTGAGGGWEQVPGQQCQYKGRLIPAVITMMVGGLHKGTVVKDWIGRSDALPWEPDEVFKWFRRGERWGDIGNVEVSQMVQVFYILACKKSG